MTYVDVVDTLGDCMAERRSAIPSGRKRYVSKRQVPVFACERIASEYVSKRQVPVFACEREQASSARIRKRVVHSICRIVDPTLAGSGVFVK